MNIAGLSIHIPFLLLLNHLKISKHFTPKYFSRYLLRIRISSNITTRVLYVTAKKSEFCPSEISRQSRDMIRIGGLETSLAAYMTAGFMGRRKVQNY